MSGKATSAGTKVTPSDAPTYREGAGAVAPDSLAAESIQAGGEFATNRNIHTTPSSTTNTTNAASQQPHETPREAAANATSSQGAPAPTYVNAQRIRDPAGPHGKNLTEDPEMTGRPGKFDVEVGSVQDPAREAEKSFARRDAAGAPGGGNGSAEQPFEVLGRETDA